MHHNSKSRRPCSPSPGSCRRLTMAAPTHRVFILSASAVCRLCCVRCSCGSQSCPSACCVERTAPKQHTPPCCTRACSWSTPTTGAHRCLLLLLWTLLFGVGLSRASLGLQRHRQPPCQQHTNSAASSNSATQQLPSSAAPGTGCAVRTTLTGSISERAGSLSVRFIGCSM